jgi:lipoyl(octanoyl) transferase
VRDWRLILGVGDAAGLCPAAGARNMAVDHALRESVEAGGRPVLRLYRWKPACLSLGRNQHAAGLYDEARARTAGIDIVRRPTGGLAVLHDRELTYCVLAPLELLGGARNAYHAINRSLVDGLRRLGVPADMAGDGFSRDPRRDAAEPCFQAPASGEVVALGRKLVGSAQRCENRTLLQHGSILLDGSQQTVRQLHRAAPDAALAAGAASDVALAVGSITIAELCGSVPAWDDLIAAVTAGFAHVNGTRLAPDSLTAFETERALQLETIYGSAAWTWRR